MRYVERIEDTWSGYYYRLAIKQGKYVAGVPSTEDRNSIDVYARTLREIKRIAKELAFSNRQIVDVGIVMRGTPWSPKSKICLMYTVQFLDGKYHFSRV